MFMFLLFRNSFLVIVLCVFNIFVNATSLAGEIGIQETVELYMKHLGKEDENDLVDLEDKESHLLGILKLVQVETICSQHFKFSKEDLIDAKTIGRLLELIAKLTDVGKDDFLKKSEEFTMESMNAQLAQFNFQIHSLEDVIKPEFLPVLRVQFAEQFEKIKILRMEKFQKGYTFHDVIFDTKIKVPEMNPDFLQDQFRIVGQNDPYVNSKLKIANHLRRKQRLKQQSLQVDEIFLNISKDKLFSALAHIKSSDIEQIQSGNVEKFEDFIDRVVSSSEEKNKKKIKKGKIKNKKKRSTSKKNIRNHSLNDSPLQDEGSVEFEDLSKLSLTDLPSNQPVRQVITFNHYLDDLHFRLIRWLKPFHEDRIQNFKDGNQFKYFGLSHKELVEQWIMHQGVHFISFFENHLESEQAQKYFIELKQTNGRQSFVAKARLSHVEPKKQKKIHEGFLVLSKGEDQKTWIHAKFQDYSPKLTNIQLSDLFRNFFGPELCTDAESLNGQDDLDFIPIGLFMEKSNNGLLTLKLENACLSIYPK